MILNTQNCINLHTILSNCTILIYYISLLELLHVSLLCVRDITLTFKNNKMKNLNSLILLITLLITSFCFGQNNVKETETSLILNGVEFSKDAPGFNNLFELKEKRNKIIVNLSHFNHAFKVVHTYNNVTIIKILNSSYFEANKTKQYIKYLNKNQNIKFIK